MNPQKILLVEDEESIRSLYEMQLTKAGFAVTAVGTGEAGQDELKKNTFDILLLDIMLPGINGLQVLRDFKAANPSSPTKVVMLTNLGQDTVIKEGFELGATAFLIKASLTPDQVINEVKTVLAGGAPSNPNPSQQTSQAPAQPAAQQPPAPEEKPTQ